MEAEQPTSLPSSAIGSLKHSVILFLNLTSSISRLSLPIFIDFTISNFSGINHELVSLFERFHQGSSRLLHIYKVDDPSITQLHSRQNSQVWMPQLSILIIFIIENTTKLKSYAVRAENLNLSAVSSWGFVQGEFFEFSNRLCCCWWWLSMLPCSFVKNSSSLIHKTWIVTAL